MRCFKRNKTNTKIKGERKYYTYSHKSIKRNAKYAQNNIKGNYKVKENAKRKSNTLYLNTHKLEIGYEL